ncbi:hypothetical protein PO909_029869 [Leuciscus waleckii]
MCCASHKAAASRRERQLSIASFCGNRVAPPQPSANVVTPPAVAPEATATTRAVSASSSSAADIRVALGGTATLRAEVLWCLHTAEKRHSLNSNENLAEVFKAMFPDSDIAKSFTCGKDKTGYIIRFGLAPHFKQELINTINKAGQFVLMFDESLNQSTKTKQLDVHIRFWEDDRVQSTYLGSQFLGHGKAVDLLHHIKTEHAELYGAHLVNAGSCGLHTLHNALKAGFTMWQMDKLLRAFHYLFHNVPARREDFTALTGSTSFPLPFCGHRWIENVPVAERAVQVWPMVMMYVDAVKQKKLPNPSTASYDTIEAAQADPLMIAKLQFFLAISRTFSLFLTNYQTDEPVLPFFAKDLSELLKDATSLRLTKIDVADEVNWVSYKNIDIGLGAESAIKSLLLLSHRQAMVERGFSINKEVETCNILEKSMEALRLICDKISVCGGVLKVLTKELMASVACARSRYRSYLEDERKKKQSSTQDLKRKAMQEEIEDLKRKRTVLTEVCDSLQTDADKLAEQAEGKSGTLMAQLTMKSNILRRRSKEKRNELVQTEKLLGTKSEELRHMSA